MKRDIDIREFLDLTIEEIFADRFSRYSKYIIQDRALPDVRDGLKPVQRRIIYSMNKEGNNFDKTFRKSAKTVGNVIGNYHPHGDTSVYDAMVRMSQTWKVNEQLVLMHGNNGSIDGDSAAAMRYTEAKLSKYSELMVRNINEDTIKMIPNFDDTELEPTVLPTRIPNLLINGASGISSGYATDIPPHNPIEIIKAAMYLNENKDATLEDIMQIVPGPDFPTGPIAQGKEGIIQAYKTGRGKIVMRSQYHFDKNNIVITSVAYEVNKSTLLQKIDMIRIDKKVDGIVEVLDQSDQSGLEIHIVCKKDANKDVIINYLFKNTDLQKNYNFNMIAISNRKPTQLGIMEILQAFLEHRVDVITRRSEYRLLKAKQKLHILEGIIKAVSILDDVIKIIRSSKNKQDSKDNLIKKYEFTDPQAEAVVMMQLYRLSNTDLVNLQETVEELQAKVNILNKILSNRSVLDKLISTELSDVLEQIDHPRRTIIQDEIKEIKIDQQQLIKQERMIVSISENGYIKRTSPRSYLASQVLSSVNDSDKIINNVMTNTREFVLIFFNDGTYVIVPVHEINELKWKEQGKHISSIAKVNDGVKVIGIVSTANYKESEYLYTITKAGYATKMKFSDLELNKLKQKIQWQKLKKDDVIIGVDFDSTKSFDQLFSAKIIAITNLGRYMKVDKDYFELYQVKRMGKKLSTLRKNEEFITIKVFDTDLLLFSENSYYAKYNKEKVVDTDKLSCLYQLVKSNNQEINVIHKINNIEILRLVDKEEEIIEVKNLKYSDVEERLKLYAKNQVTTNIENILKVTE